MTDAHPGELAPGDDGDIVPGSAPVQSKHWPRRHWLHVLVGAVPGVVFGVSTGNALSRGGLEAALTPYVVIPFVGLPLVALLIASAITKRSGPAIAAVALGGAFVAGWILAPPAAGSMEGATGTGEVAPHADAAAIWSGPITCKWHRDVATAVESVGWYHVSIADPAFQAERLADDSVEVWVYPADDGSLGYDDGNGGFQTLPVKILTQSADGRSGTAGMVAGDFPGWSASANARVAALRDSDIVFRWACEGGP